ncbi:hypothetical protein GGR56DRAFT_177772 [Xylariaceae sp. FL0804]|nr:hypothetical protein GGR56DRAFT_177772 [Xylariaceae sp. FL0804]
MKASTMIAGVFAAVATALPTTSSSSSSAPATEKRTISLSSFNNFGFNDLNLQYINALNQFDLQAFAQLGQFNNLDISGFQSLFSSSSFDLSQLLQLQQIAMLAQLGNLGVFGNFDLSSVQIQAFDLGLINSISGFDVSSLIDSSLVSQIQTVVSSTQVATVVI